MAPQSTVTPNRRGIRSRELVLDAAEHVMAEDGFEAATLARLVEESGVPLSSVYHYYGSKEGIVLAVMERGAERFFAELPDPDRRIGRSAEHLSRVVTSAVQALERQPHFLRILVVFAVQPPRAGGDEIAVVVARVRELALKRLRKQIAIAFDDDPRSSSTDQLARFALAAFDGAFIGSQSDPEVNLGQVLQHLPPALVAARRTATRTPGSRPARP